MTETTQRKSAKRHTSLGTPCSPAWDSDWIAVVETREREVGHRICGARTLAGTACPLKPNHKNGRCKYHGGFDLTGAQPGNRNAVIHGLYTRGLTRCGEKCPMWESCPCASEDVAQLPATERPICPYEKTQYDAAVTDALPRVPKTVCSQPHPLYRHVAHQYALLQVMMTRAGAALALSADSNPLTTSGEGASGQQKSQLKGGCPHLTAFLRISAEYRRYLKLVEVEERQGLTETDLLEHRRRAGHDVSQEPEHQVELDQTEPLVDQFAAEVVDGAWHEVRNQRPHDAQNALNRAVRLAPHVVAPERPQLEEAIAQKLAEIKKRRKKGSFR
jgi:hypothetical protein